MKITQLLMFTTTAVVLHSMSSSGTVDAWWPTDSILRGGVESLGIKSCSNSDCSSNTECHESERCIDSKCVSACLEEDCKKKHEACLVRKHKAKCVCEPGYAKKTGCKKCEKEDCQDNSDCIGDYLCRSVDNFRTCSCPTGTKNREHGFCAKPCTETANCTIHGAAICETTSAPSFCVCEKGKNFNMAEKKCQ